MSLCGTPEVDPLVDGVELWLLDDGLEGEVDCEEEEDEGGVAL
jgi:hypothetical protein